MDVEGNIRNRPPGDQDQELSDTKRTMINIIKINIKMENFTRELKSFILELENTVTENIDLLQKRLVN